MEKQSSTPAKETPAQSVPAPVIPAAPKAKLTPVFQMLGESWGIYRKNYKNFLLLALLGIAGNFLLPFSSLLAGGAGSAAKIIGLSAGFVISWITFFLMLVSWIGFFLLLKNPQPKFKELFKDSLKYFWKYALVICLTLVYIILWGLLLIIPGIIFGIFYALAVYALFFEEFEGGAAIKRSRELVKNYWWQVFGRFLFFGVLILLVGALLSMLIFYLGGLGLPADVSLADPRTFSILYVVALIIAFAFVILRQFLMTALYLVYKDLAKIKGPSALSAKGRTNKLALKIIIIIALVFSVAVLVMSIITSLNSYGSYFTQ